jgi:hypothetical protein
VCVVGTARCVDGSASSACPLMTSPRSALRRTLTSATGARSVYVANTSLIDTSTDECLADVGDQVRREDRVPVEVDEALFYRYRCRRAQIRGCIACSVGNVEVGLADPQCSAFAACTETGNGNLAVRAAFGLSGMWWSGTNAGREA